MSRAQKLAPEVNRYAQPLPLSTPSLTPSTALSSLKTSGRRSSPSPRLIALSRTAHLLSPLTSYNVTPDELFDLFGKFGAIRQIRQGINNNTKGTAFVVYEDVMEAKQACDKLNGFNFQNRYLVVLYHQIEKVKKPEELAERQANLERVKKEHGIE